MGHASRFKSTAVFLALTNVMLWLGMHPNQSMALEERVEGLSASVEVASVFSLDISKVSLAFNDVSPGKTRILEEGHAFNEIRCRSNSGRPWYLKAQVVSLRHIQGTYEMPVSSLKWKIMDFTGSGQPAEGRIDFHAFSDQSGLVYASQGDDDRGREVVLKFQYSLSAPPDALAGSYIGQVVFTMTEAP